MKKSFCAYATYSWLIFIVLAFSQCSIQKHLGDDEQLYVGSKVKFLDKENLKHKELEQQLLQDLRPRPNRTFLGLTPLRLRAYLNTKEPTGKGVRHFLKERYGEKPVLTEDLDRLRRKQIIKSNLVAKGYFNASVEEKEVEDEYRSTMVYEVRLRPAFVLGEVKWPEGDLPIEEQIRKMKDRTVLKAGEVYNFDLIKKERSRIASALKDHGFYYFHEDYLIFKVDTHQRRQEVIPYLRIKKETPEQATSNYRLNQVFFHINYSGASDEYADTTVYDGGYVIIENDSMIHHRHILKANFLSPPDFYTDKLRSRTLEHLNNLGVFRFVSIRFENVDTASRRPKLDAHIYLDTREKRSIGYELRGVSKSNDFIGPGLNVDYTSHNFLRGAERLSFNLVSAYETQIGQRQAGINSIELGAEARLSIPRFTIFHNWFHISDRYLSKTNFMLGYRLLRRVQFFSLNSFNFEYGYQWNERSHITHRLKPVVINFLTLFNRSEAFDGLLERTPFLRASFEEQFIIGSSYSYNIQEQPENSGEGGFYLNAAVDVSGNFLSLVNTTAKQFDEGGIGFLDNPYAQFSRFELDYRYYYKFSDDQKLAVRGVAGLGYAYGNSTTMPFIKQFFTGGPNSIRAFQARGLGPGTYRTEEDLGALFFFDQVGDVKLESSLEYRFGVVGFLKGAVFLDAGNIWLRRADEDRPGGQFEIDNFHNDLAVGTGFGARFDFSFFVFRLDLGFPLRIPYLPEGQRWVHNDIRPGQANWRRNRLVLNLAFGYPF